MIISIGGKCSDMGWFQVTEDGATLIEHDGYVPEISALGGGDYIEIDIDNETGKVVGWKPLTIGEIKEAMGDDFDEDEDEE